VGRLLLRHGPELVVVHGAATGIEQSIAEACAELGVEQEAHHARWQHLDHPEAVIRYDKNGRPYNADAGPARNAAMVAAGAEPWIAFRFLARSRGTKDCVRRALAAGIPTYLIDTREARPRRLQVGDARLR
jgi:hypothetical protein